PNALPGKFRSCIKSLQPVAANGPPSDDGAVQFGNPYFQLTQLSLHTGERELRRPRPRVSLGHRWRRKLQDRSPSDVVETACVLAHRHAVNGTHRHLPRVKMAPLNQRSMATIER